MDVVVASRSPVKLEAVRLSLKKYNIHEQHATIISVDMRHLNLPEQPIGLAHTRECARIRLQEARNMGPGDLFVAIEGGFLWEDNHGWTFAAMAVYSFRDDAFTQGCSPWLPLPDLVTRRLWRGEELGPLNDEIFGLKESKSEQGAAGLYTGGAVDRTMFYVSGLVPTLAPHFVTLPIPWRYNES